MTEKFLIVPRAAHFELVKKAYLHRGFTELEALDAVRLCEMATTHGIRTHNAIKAIHLDELFGSGNGGCVPGAEIRDIPTKFEASKIWDAQRKLGQSVAFAAMEECIKLADKYGIGQVSVDNAFHYLWGGGYVMDAASRGYIAYTNCTSSLAEVVPFGGKFPTMGTNPHSWGFPTTDAVGFPIVIDWATSTVAMGRVQQFRRENKELPPGSAVDEDGKPTTDPHRAVSLLPFGAHKGYGMCLINEVVAALIGGSLPTLRSRVIPEGEKKTCNFYFSVIHPDAINAGAFAQGRNQAENIRAVLTDILGYGNDGAMLPGQLEAESARKCESADGLLFSEAEVEALNHMARVCGAEELDMSQLTEFAG